MAATYAEGAAKKRRFARKLSKQRLQIINLYSNHVETITKHFLILVNTASGVGISVFGTGYSECSD